MIQRDGLQQTAKGKRDTAKGGRMVPAGAEMATAAMFTERHVH
jgi:hypothetical protein